jgi:iron(III) transport system permease protein
MGWASDVLPIVPLLVPALAISIGWVFLLSPRAGVVNTTIRSVLGLDAKEGPLDIFTWPGMIFVYTIELVPYVYLIVSAALRNIDPALEEASRTSGASPFATFRRITAPAIKPAIASSALLVLVIGFAIFSVPSIIGTTAEIDVLSVQIVRLLNGTFPPRTDEAVALSLVVLVIVVGAWTAQRRILRSGHFATIGGKGVRHTRVELGLWKWVARLGMGLYVAAATLLPVIGLAFVSLQSFWTAVPHFDRFNLNAYRAVFGENDQTSQAIFNSTVLAAVGATAGILVALTVALFVQQRSGPLTRALDGITKLPGTFSHIVLAVGLLVVLAASPFNLAGTALLVLIGYVVIYLPQGAVTAGSAVTQVGAQLTEASRVCGAGEGRTLRKIQIPLMLPGLAGGWALLFVLMIGDVTASAILASPSSPVTGFVLLQLWQNGTYPLIAALALVVTIVSSVVVITVLRLTRGKAAIGVNA